MATTGQVSPHSLSLVREHREGGSLGVSKLSSSRGSLPSIEADDGGPSLSSSKADHVSILGVNVNGLQKDSEVVGMGNGDWASTLIFGGVDLPGKVLASSACHRWEVILGRGERFVLSIVEK